MVVKIALTAHKNCRRITICFFYYVTIFFAINVNGIIYRYIQFLYCMQKLCYNFQKLLRSFRAINFLDGHIFHLFYTLLLFIGVIIRARVTINYFFGSLGTILYMLHNMHSPWPLQNICQNVYYFMKTFLNLKEYSLNGDTTDHTYVFQV